MEKPRLRVAIYCRVARADQDDLDTQKEDMQRLATHLGCSNPLCFADNGVSGHNYDRLGFSQLEDTIRAKEIEAIIMRDISRIGRDYIKTAQWIDWLERQGVKLITSDQYTKAESCFDFRKAMQSHMRSRKDAQKNKA